MHIVQNYSRRSLTYRRDKLVALNGLAKHFQANGLQDYFAGSWKANIREIVFWKSTYGPECDLRTTEYIAPSWSWASLPYNIAFSALLDAGRLHWNENSLKRRYLARICSISVEESISGQLRSGRLVVVGQIITLKPVCSTTDHNSAVKFRCQLAYERVFNVCSACPDYENEFLAEMLT